MNVNDPGNNYLKISPKVDFVFRMLFGMDENKDLLISLINSVVKLDAPIIDIEIKNPFNLAKYDGQKESIVDIKAVDEKGRWFNVEMQLYTDGFYGKRALYYCAQEYAGQLEKGESYSKLCTTIGIHFLDFKYFEDERFVRQFVFKDVETNEAPEELSYIQLYFVEMSKFRKDWPEIQTDLDRWVSLFNRAKELDKDNLPLPLRGDTAIVKAVTQLDRISMSPAERELYERQEKELMVDKSVIESAEIRGEKRGRQEGKLEGKEEAVNLLLSRRFSTLPDHITEKLDRLTSEQYDSLIVALLDLSSLSELETWLNEQTK